MGRAINRHGNGGRAAHDRDASCFQPRRGAPVRRQRFLLSRSEFWRLSDDVHEAAKLCRARPVFSFTLWRDNGAVAVLVSQELLSLLHVGRFGDLSRAGFRSVLQARTWRTSTATESAGPHYGRVYSLRREASRSGNSVYANRVSARSGARV